MVEIIINYGDSNKDQQSHHSFTILTVRNNPCVGDFTVKAGKKKKRCTEKQRNLLKVN